MQLHVPHRLSHMYVIAEAETAEVDLARAARLSPRCEDRQGLVLVDPHGDLVERIVARVPADRKSDVISLDVQNLPGRPRGTIH